ncbi:MAG TPA: VWA domain-containing protein [Dehalococcoidia bacterium]|nr:VWA domain-containing protein [Dehalococcoidia bacterium]
MLITWPWSIDSFGLQAPEALVFLLLLPVVVGAYVLMQLSRRKYAVRYASVSLLREAVGKGPGIRRHIPAALYLVALGAMIFALSRPKGIVENAFDTGTVILAIDVSGSMWAEDVAPNRMEATKAAVKEFVKKQPKGVEIGIVSFSDFGILSQAPTRDKRAVNKAVDRLQPQRGTNIGGGLQAALDAIYEGADTPRPGAQNRSPFAPVQPTPVRPAASGAPPAATIVLLSDGQSNTGPSPLAVAEEAVAAGIKVFTIGIGTPQGTVLRIQGRNVFTRLDEETLQAIADATGGKYLSAQDEKQLANVYDELARERQSEPQERDLTYYVTGVALLFSLVAGGFSLAWFNRLP